MTDQPPAALRLLPAVPEVAQCLSEIATLLWRERDVLEDLLYALSVQQLVLDAGDPRWLPRADAAVQSALRAVQEQEIARAGEIEVLVAQVGPSFGVSGDSSLRDLASVAPEPWPTVLDDHRAALCALAAQIDAVTAENRTLLAAGERVTREMVERIGELDSVHEGWTK